MRGEKFDRAGRELAQQSQRVVAGVVIGDVQAQLDTGLPRQRVQLFAQMSRTVVGREQDVYKRQ